MYIGKDIKTANKIKLSDDARKANLAVFGIKNTGKAYTLIPVLFNQDLKNKDKGVTIVVDTPGLAWYLYGISKIIGRKVDILKPSIDLKVMDGLLFKPEWNYDEIDKIYSYEKSVKEKKVVIIDMEQEKYGEKAVRAVSMLLLQLQSVMIMDRPKKLDYSVFIDDAGSYIPYVHNLLKYGDYYGFTSTLFFKSREELGPEKRYVDDFIRNYILLQGINFEDAKYFGERMAVTDNPKTSAQRLMDRSYGTIFYEILREGSYERLIGQADLLEFEDSVKKQYRTRAANLKKKAKEIDTGDHHYQLSKEKKALETKEEDSVSKDLEKDLEKEVKKVKPVKANNKEKIEIEITEESEPEINEEDLIEAPSEISDVEEIEFSEEIPEEKGKEPQLNKKIKTQSFKKKEIDMSSIENFDLPDSIEPTEEIEFSEEIPDEALTPEGPVEDIPEVEKEPEFDLSKKFSFGNKDFVPYKKIQNRKIEKELEDFKL